MDQLKELTIGTKIANSGLFDSDYYLSRNPDVAATGLDPVIHYIRYGEKEGRKPSADFDLKKYARLLDCSENILFHYICHRENASVRKQEIPVVFACDNIYAPYLGVALTSLAANAGLDREYSIFVLYLDLAEENRQRLKSLSKENLNIQFIDVKKRLPEELKTAYISEQITQTAYARLAIPQIFPHYEKIIYLDCDLIITRDLAEFYSIDLGKAACGAVQEIFLDLPFYRKLRQSMPEEVGTYFNSGVILFNTANFNKHNLYRKCCELARTGREFICHDQDILNIACNKFIKPVEYTWNFQWNSFAYGNHKFMSIDDFRMYARYFHKPAVVHFTSDKKPVNFDDRYFAEMFWEYAESSPFYEELLEMRTYD